MIINSYRVQSRLEDTFFFLMLLLLLYIFSQLLFKLEHRISFRIGILLKAVRKKGTTTTVSGHMQETHFFFVWFDVC